MPRRSLPPLDTAMFSSEPFARTNVWSVANATDKVQLLSEELIALAEQYPARTFDKGQRIFGAEEPSGGVHLVLFGRVKLSMPDAAFGERILAISGADELFGTAACTAQAAYGVEAVALERGTRIVTLTCSQFQAVARHVPSVAVAVTQALAERVRELEAQVMWATLPAHVRLARTLLSLTKRFGVEIESGLVDVLLNLKHDEIASLAGTTRVSATRALSAWRSMGIVEGTRGAYRVKVEKLEALAQYLEYEFAS